MRRRPRGSKRSDTQAADDQAFLARIQTHDRSLRSLAYRLVGDPEAMDEVLQEAYLKAYAARDGFRGDAEFGTWLYRITYNTCVDYLRRMPDERPLDTDLVCHEGWQDSAEVVLDVQAALSGLKPDHKAILLLVDADGFSYAEAAEVLGVSEGTVASRLSRARQALRANLPEYQQQRGLGR